MTQYKSQPNANKPIAFLWTRVTNIWRREDDWHLCLEDFLEEVDIEQTSSGNR